MTGLSPQRLSDVDGLVAVVTGGGTGIGLMIAKALEANGAKVYITGRRQDRIEDAARQAAHGNIIPVQGSTSSHDDIQRLVDLITKETGYVDLLVCNAGQTTWDASPNAPKQPTPESSISEIRDYFFNYRPTSVWNQTLETNITAVFTNTMAFLELLDEGNKRRAKDKPTSQVIAVGSVGGLSRATPSFIYNASKAGVTHLMKNLGAFLIPHKIRTNVIAPGWFPSEMTTSVTARYEATDGVMPQSVVPQERMGNADEIAGTILYLASKAGGYCNGNVMVIDGGFLHNHAGS